MSWKLICVGRKGARQPSLGEEWQRDQVQEGEDVYVAWRGRFHWLARVSPSQASSRERCSSGLLGLGLDP